MADNTWCKLHFPETIVDLYLIYQFSVRTLSLCVVLGKKKQKRFAGDCRCMNASFFQSVLEIRAFFLQQFLSVCNSRSSHLDVGNMVSTSIFLMFHGQLLSSSALFNYWQKLHISAFSSKVPFVNPHTMRWTWVLWPRLNEKQQTDTFMLMETFEVHHSMSKTSILLYIVLYKLN